MHISELKSKLLEINMTSKELAKAFGVSEEELFWRVVKRHRESIKRIELIFYIKKTEGIVKLVRSKSNYFE